MSARARADDLGPTELVQHAEGPLARRRARARLQARSSWRRVRRARYAGIPGDEPARARACDRRRWHDRLGITPRSCATSRRVRAKAGFGTTIRPGDRPSMPGWTGCRRGYSPTFSTACSGVSIGRPITCAISRRSKRASPAARAIFSCSIKCWRTVPSLPVTRSAWRIFRLAPHFTAISSSRSSGRRCAMSKPGIAGCESVLPIARV